MAKATILSTQQINNIQSRWEAEGVCALAKEFHVSTERIKLIAFGDKSGLVSKRRRAPKYKFDEGCFSIITDSSAYWIGFLLADGCLTRTKTQPRSFMVNVGLHQKDRNHLEKLRRFINYEGPLLGTQESPQLVWCSVEHAAALMWYGLSPRKSGKEDVTEPSLADNRHFWRGVVDGDGSLCFESGRFRLSLCGSQELLSKFKTFANVNYSISSMGSIWQICLYSSEAVRVAALLYDDSKDHLDRKKAIAQEVTALPRKKLLH